MGTLFLKSNPHQVHELHKVNGSITEGRLTVYGRRDILAQIFEKPTMLAGMDYDLDTSEIYLNDVRLGTGLHYYCASWLSVPDAFEIHYKESWSDITKQCIAKLDMYKDTSMHGKLEGFDTFMSWLGYGDRTSDILELAMNNMNDLRRVERHVCSWCPELKRDHLRTIMTGYLPAIIGQLDRYTKQIIKVSHGLILGNSQDSDDYWEYVHRNDPGLAINNAIFKTRVSF